MATSREEKPTVSPSIIHPDVKQQRQHSSLFNLDLFNDDRAHLTNCKHPATKKTIDQCCCSSSTPNVDDACETNSLPHSCSYAVLQKNYTTQLEYVAETLLADEHPTTNPCPYCSTFDSTESKPSSLLNRKLLFGSAAILDSFLRNNVRTSANTSHTVTSSTTNTGSSQRRWHSERATRHPNVRANLPLTPAQRQVLERYINYSLMQPPTNIRSTRRSHIHQPITGKAGEATGTALSALAEQPVSHPTTAIVHLRKNSAPTSHTQTYTRPLSSTSSSASHHSALLNRRCFLADTIPFRDDDDDDNDSSSSSEFDSSSDEETSEIIQTSVLPMASIHPSSLLTESLSECSICCEMRRLQKRPCCQFDACNACLNNYVEQQVKQGLVRIQCPNQGCQSYLHRDEIYKRCTSSELRQKLTRFLADANRASNIRTCPRCSNLHEIGLELVFWSTAALFCLLFRSRTEPIETWCPDESSMCPVQFNLVLSMPFTVARWNTMQRVSSWRSYAEEMGTRSSLWTAERPAMSILQGKHVLVRSSSTNVLFRCISNEPKAVIISFACAVKPNSATNAVIGFAISNSSVRGSPWQDDLHSLECLLGDHYSELSVLGCKYRFYPDRPFKRRLIRGSILGGKILAAPVVLCFAVAAGTVCATIGLPAYCCVMLVRHIKVLPDFFHVETVVRYSLQAKRRRRRHANLKEPVLMSCTYSSFADGHCVGSIVMICSS